MRNSQAGFSLVEIMVAVGVVAVLATVAVPNFMYMAAKARQSEAKEALAAIYAAEKSFHADQSSFTYCLTQAGYMPELSNHRYYLVGFLNGMGSTCYKGYSCWTYDFAVGTQCNFVGTVWGGSTRNDATYGQNAWANPNLINQNIGPSYSVWDKDHFTAVAFGSVMDRSPVFDVWSINEVNNFKNDQPGL